MNKDKYVYAQLVLFMDRNHFNHLVRKYDGDKYVKSYTCWNQLLTLMFGQLSNRESLRELIVAMEAHAGKLYHLGIGKSVTRSNLSKANEQRDCRIFEEFALYMITEARKRRIQKIFELDGHVYAFDSTTIDLCLSVFEWAKFRKHKGGIKMHTLYDVEAQVPAFVHITEAKVHDSKAMPEIPYEKGAHYIFDRGYNDFGNLYTINRIEAFFVVRAKTNVRFKPETWKRRLPENVVSDAIGCFTVYKSSKDYPEKLRKVVCIDPEDGTKYIFLTNNLMASAETIAELYRNRWSVELFFKWIKQHLRIKRFWGTSENAVRIQIYCVIITYCLVAIVQHDMMLERSIYEIFQILGISLTDKTHLRDLFDKSNFKNVNVLYGSYEPNLFNFQTRPFLVDSSEHNYMNMKYLLVVAHPDDEVLGAGASMWKWSHDGDEVEVCIMCTEAKARAFRPSDAELEGDTDAAVSFLGVKKKYEGTFPNIEMNTVPHLKLVQFIESAIRESEPDVIITHHPADTNNDHLQTSMACQEAIRLFQRRPEVKRVKEFWYMEVPSCTEWKINNAMKCFEPNCYVEVGKEGVDAKIKALGMYRGVMRPYPHPRSAEYITGLAAVRGGQWGCNYAEAFELVQREY